MENERNRRRARRHGEPEGASKSPVVAATARPSVRELWFRRYPASQTIISFIVALISTTAFSVDPMPISKGAVLALDPTATGALFICYEVLLSLAGHVDAVMLLALAILLTLPFRYVFFGRRDSWRPSVVVPSIVFALCMVFGRSYDLTSTADLAIGNHARTICSVISGIGWALLAHVAIYIAFEGFDWLRTHRIRFSEGRYGRVYRLLHLLLSERPFLIPFTVLVVAWLPTLIGSMPGIFMGDTGAQIRQWFNLPNGTSDYLRLINPNVLLNGHHPVVHTAIIGTCVKIGIDMFHDCNAGLALYTSIQFVITAMCLAYAVSTLRRFGVSLVVRGIVLVFFVAMPMFSNYAVLLTKDVLFADSLLVLVVQMAKLLAAGRERGGERAQAFEGERRRPLFAAHDWVVLVVSALGTTFLRNGGAVFPLAVCVVAAAFAAFDAHRRMGAVRRDLRWAGILAVLAVCLAANWGFTNIFMPAHDITPGSKREMLSIPFQQTARFVQKHDGLNSGVADGVSDGLVTKHERRVIDRVLHYEDLGSRYDPNKSDAVKNRFNECATDADLRAYFKVWAEMFKKDPECYVSALTSNYYGYFYPSQKDVWFYSTVQSEHIMDRPDNQLYFPFAPSKGHLTRVCDHLVTLYRVAIQRIPLLSLTMSSASYVWVMIVVAVYLLRNRDWRSLALWVPVWGVLAVCLIGPCNGATYMRYLYPAILAIPFVVAVTCTRCNAIDMQG